MQVLGRRQFDKPSSMIGIQSNEAVTKTRTGLEMDWRWTGAFLILSTSEQPFLTFNK